MPFPDGLTLVTVAGQVEAPPAGVTTVTFRSAQWINIPARDRTIAPFTVTAQLDGAGAFLVQLPATDDPAYQRPGWTYAVEVRWGNERLRAAMPVPISTVGTLQASDVLIIDQPANPGAVRYLTAADKGTAGGVASLGPDGLVPAGQLPPGNGGSAVASVNGRTGAVTLTKTDVGLSAVDNTSDAAKPISTATAAALALKATAASLAAVATSGAYADLTGRPNIPSVLVLSATAPIPGGTPAGTVVVRTTSS